MLLGPTKHFQKVGANMWLGPIKDVGPRRWENVGKELWDSGSSPTSSPTSYYEALKLILGRIDVGKM